MKEGPDIVRIAALVGDPARANMLLALMSGRALTPTELSIEAGVTPQTASFHIAKLQEGGLLTLRKQGRHRYLALASQDVADVLERLMVLAEGAGHARVRTGPKDVSLRRARVCYNHLAGELGTAVYRSFVARNYLTVGSRGLDLTDEGSRALEAFGIDIGTLRRHRAPLCRECLDWSERTSHLAGSVGRAILARIEELGWARRDPRSRAVLFTPSGEDRLRATLLV